MTAAGGPAARCAASANLTAFFTWASILLGWPSQKMRPSWPTMYAFGVLTVAAGQAIVIYGLGLPLLMLLKRLKVGEGFDGTGE